MKIKRICIDLDGVICQLKQPGQTYADVEPIAGAIERINELKSFGHYIIILTARHMKTCQGNVGLVQQRVAQVTLEWLEKHGVEYDEIHFGKPWADIYIDDNAYRFNNWTEIDGDGQNLPQSHEKSVRGDE
ncbi:5' nucleotidase, NT5C type [Sulfurimonas diazotrophicus]|uniref:Capsular biosynthesis protein n=1 Tax=Sulfurimonas diazotrophicus TaxID=3131939 RepID=A0ABZ3HAL8_9BACT